MAQHLQLTIRFFTDRYHGGDWPPSPARLYQALVAGAKTGARGKEWSVRHQGALEWFERLGPPQIFARRSQAGKQFTLFVPNNSLAGEMSTRTSKPVAPRVLADHCPGAPDVVYLWPIEDAGAARDHLGLLDQIASRLCALGWGVDFAAAIAHLTDDTPSPGGLEHFTPGARGGTALHIPTSGFLEHLEECHRAFTGRITREGVNPYTRPTRFGQTRYQRAQSWRPRRWIAFELETPEGAPFAARWDQAQIVAAWVRHAAGEAMRQEDLSQAWIDSFVLGHTAPDDLGHRLSFVPLPSIGHQHSDGGIRRVLIVEPPDAEAGVEALDLLRIKLAGWALTDERGVRRALLTPLRDERKVLPFYEGEAVVWQTVTPVVLHGHNAARGRISLAKTDRLLCQAFESAGFPQAIIDSITFQPAAYWPGARASTAIRVPRHLAEWPRVHVRVAFKEPVQGPVLAGIGRHYGIGVFAALREG
jgi:CRISPR-associated protein Csb2